MMLKLIMCVIIMVHYSDSIWVPVIACDQAQPAGDDLRSHGDICMSMSL